MDKIIPKSFVSIYIFVYLCSVFKNKRAVKDSEKGRELQILAIKEYERYRNKGVADAEREAQGGNGPDAGRC